MKRTLHVVSVVIVVAGAAWSASAASLSPVAPTGGGIVAQALRATKVTLLSKAPGEAGGVLATASGAEVSGALASGELQRASYARLTVGARSAVFVVDRGAAAQGRLLLHVSGAPGARSARLASLPVVATDLFEASQGDRPLLLLARGQGAGTITFALYDPAMAGTGNALDAAGADRASLWLNGSLRSYAVRASGESLADVVIASGHSKGRSLAAVLGVAGVQG